MSFKKSIFALASLFALNMTAQETVQNEVLDAQPVKLSFLDSIKSTFIKDEMAQCVDSMWLTELASLDIYNDLTDDITKINLDEKVDFELSTELLKERLAKLDAKSPFNIEYNPGLENIIKSFLKNRKRSYERLMAISEYYFPMFEEALARQNVPLEIKYLAIVESALNPKAVSRMGATGLWQFMYQTGKQYNLHIDSYVDERSDPLKASDAAAQYMANMYKIFGDWDLVLASYNSGPGNVAKAIRRSGGKQNYWNIRKHLPKETQGYVPAFLATMYIYEYHKEHGIVPQRALVKHFETDTVMVKNQLTFKQLSALLDMPVAQLEMLNPSYKLKTVPSYDSKPHYLRLPKDKMALFTSNEDKIYAYARYEADQREKPFSSVRTAIASTQDSADDESERQWVSRTKYYKVRRGDNLSSIADRHGVGLSELKKWNGLRSNKVNAGTTLKIKTNQAVAAKPKKETPKPAAPVAQVEEAVAAANPSDDFYVLQQGESLSAIARKHNLSVADLKKLNNFEDDALLAGTKIKVSEPAAEVEAKPEVRLVEYVVKKGEFLGFIAKKHNITLEQIKEWNNLQDVNIHAGQKLIVGKIEAQDAVAEKPRKDKYESTKEYYVQKGDSLFSIAKKYPGVTVSDIKRWNGIKNGNIKPGQRLTING
ncbi:MAG TPA: LysM peptidoglycan-binding domain-containing protein [Flavobacterium sp.]|nr:LysM peptidoglycan-binding domain-containing protein [Flavobacterium sp.]